MLQYVSTAKRSLDPSVLGKNCPYEVAEKFNSRKKSRGAIFLASMVINFNI